MAKKIYHFSNGYKVLADHDVNIAELVKSVNKVHRALKITDAVEEKEIGEPYDSFLNAIFENEDNLNKLNEFVENGDWDGLYRFVYGVVLEQRRNEKKSGLDTTRTERFLDALMAMNSKEQEAYNYYANKENVPVTVTSAEEFNKEWDIKEGKKKVPAYKTISTEKYDYEWEKQIPKNSGEPQNFRPSASATKKGSYINRVKEPLFKQNGEQRMVSRPLKVGEKEAELMKIQKKLAPQFYVGERVNTTVNNEYFYQLKGPKHSLQKIYCLMLSNWLTQMWLKYQGEAALYKKTDKYTIAPEKVESDDIPVDTKIHGNDSVSSGEYSYMTRIVNNKVEDIKNRLEEVCEIYIEDLKPTVVVKPVGEPTKAGNGAIYRFDVSIIFGEKYNSTHKSDVINTLKKAREIIGTNIISAKIGEYNEKGVKYTLKFLRTSGNRGTQSELKVLGGNVPRGLTGGFYLVVEKENQEVAPSELADSVDNSFSYNAKVIVEFLNGEGEKDEQSISDNAENILSKLDYFIENGEDIYVKANWSKEDAKEAIAEDLNPLINTLETKGNSAYLKLLLKNLKSKKEDLIKAWKLNEETETSDEEVEEVEQDTEE